MKFQRRSLMKHPQKEGKQKKNAKETKKKAYARSQTPFCAYLRLSTAFRCRGLLTTFFVPPAKSLRYVLPEHVRFSRCRLFSQGEPILLRDTHLRPLPSVSIARRVGHGAPTMTAVFLPLSLVRRRRLRADTVPLLAVAVPLARLPATLVHLALRSRARVRERKDTFYA